MFSGVMYLSISSLLVLESPLQKFVLPAVPQWLHFGQRPYFSKASLSFLNSLHFRRKWEGVSFIWHTPHSGDVLKFILLSWLLIIQWPSLSCRILDYPLLVVFFSWSNICFKLLLHIAGTSSLYLSELEFAHFLAHLYIVICVFIFEN